MHEEKLRSESSPAGLGLGMQATAAVGRGHKQKKGTHLKRKKTDLSSKVGLPARGSGSSASSTLVAGFIHGPSRSCLTLYAPNTMGLAPAVTGCSSFSYAVAGFCKQLSVSTSASAWREGARRAVFFYVAHRCKLLLVVRRVDNDHGVGDYNALVCTV